MAIRPGKLSAVSRKKAKMTAPAGKTRSQAAAAKASPAADRTSGRTSRSAKTTTDHEEIRQWVESRGGHPATVQRTTKGNQPAGVLRIDFPEFSGEQSLKPISWDEWFRVFDERGLVFLHQDTRLRNGQLSRFNKLVAERGARLKA